MHGVELHSLSVPIDLSCYIVLHEPCSSAPRSCFTVIHAYFTATTAMGGRKFRLTHRKNEERKRRQKRGRPAWSTPPLVLKCTVSLLMSVYLGGDVDKCKENWCTPLPKRKCLTTD